MTPLELTGKIPNLFRDCSPVVLDPTIRNHYGGKSTGVCFAVGNVAANVVFLEDCRPLPIPLEELTLDMFNATGRFHARLYLQEQGHDVGNEDRPDVLAWSVISVWKGGRPLQFTVTEPRNMSNEWLSVIHATCVGVERNDGTLALPPLP